MTGKEKIRQGALILAWGLYDLANQFFALNIISLYFVRWLTLERGVPEIFYSIAFGVSAFLVAVLAPILGGISDRLNRRMPFLISFTLLSVIFTMVLGISNNIFLALFFFAVANFGCQAAIVFYNALIVNIAPPEKIGMVSGLGRVLAYCGALLALYLIRPVVLKSGYQATFFPTGVLFLIFALPCMIFIKDKKPQEQINISPVRNTFKGLFDCSGFPGLSDFLKASFFGLGVVNTIILFMSVYASKVFKLNEVEIINLIVFSTFFAILGSFISGYIGDRIGQSVCLTLVFILWGVALFLGAFAKTSGVYWFVGSLTGIALGATWTVSRALATRLVSREKIGEVFGLFNLVGYLSAIAGSLFWGLALLFLSPLGEIGYRITLFSLILFLVFAFVFLLRVNKALVKN